MTCSAIGVDWMPRELRDQHVFRREIGERKVTDGMRRTVQPPEPGGVFDGISRQAERERDIGGRREGDVGIAIVRVKEVDMRKAPAELVDVRQRYRPRRDAMMDRDENVHDQAGTASS